MKRYSTQQLPPPAQLLSDFSRAGGARDIPSVNRPLQLEQLERIRRELLVRGPKFLERESVQSRAISFGQSHERTHGMIRLSKGASLANEVLRQISR